ncbi:MAG: efflux RND transporter permease subunit [Planctomycetota bacterium]
MNLPRFAIRHQPVVLTALGIGLALGVTAFWTMPRREDPEILIRTCVVVTHWPGATAEKIEALVTDPIEDAIQRIDEVEEIRSESRVGTSIVSVDIDEQLTEIDQIFDEVRNKVQEASGRLPSGCGRPMVNTSFGDVSVICLVLYQVPLAGESTFERSYSYRELELYAEQIETELRTIEPVASIDILGAQEEVLTVEVDPGDWGQVALSPDQLGQLLEARNIVAPGGQLETADDRFSITPTGELQDPEQMEGVIVGFHEGRVPIRLDSLPLAITRGFEDPPRQKIRYRTPVLDAPQALVLALTMKSGRNVVATGEAVRERLADLRASSLPPDLRIEWINDLPRQVSTLVGDFVGNLWQAIVIVLVVALLMMGWRAALIMAAAIPLSMILTLAIVPRFGVQLEQFSIASLIIALGMVVDNAIVVSDNAARLIREGKPNRLAVIQGTQELAIPVLTSTLTTVGAFLPLAFLSGNSGEYIRSLPIVVATTLSVSYAVAMLVTPISCLWLLRAKPARPLGDRAMEAARRGWARFRRKAHPGDARGDAYGPVIRACLNHQLVTLGLASAALIGSLFLVPSIGSQFFPGGIRDQFFVHVWLPEGSSLAATEAACEKVERALLESNELLRDRTVDPPLRSSVTFVGSGGPRLMLTSSPEQDYTNYAFILVNTHDAEHSRRLAQELRDAVADIPDARIDIRDYALGPYIKNAIEFKIFGPDDDVLRNLAPEAMRLFRETEGTRGVTDNWRNSAYQLRVEVDPTAANLAGVTNADVAQTMSGLVSGAPLTTYREGDHSIDVMLRMPGDRRSRVSDLSGLSVEGREGKVPLDSIARILPTWQPAVIRREGGQRVIAIGSQVEEGFLSNAVAAKIRPRLETLVAKHTGYRIETSGEQEKTSESQEKILGALQLSVLLILLVLISQYNSLVKPLIVLAAAPLALIGALIGLYVTGWPLGFMPSLGIVSLVGVVINNAIILIDFIEGSVKEGTPLRDAVARSGLLRMKPILLTTMTTVGGLIPLALFGGPMWAGMAWAMIFGLVCSTALTLLVVPTLFVFFAEHFGMKVGSPDLES